MLLSLLTDRQDCHACLTSRRLQEALLNEHAIASKRMATDLQCKDGMSLLYVRYTS